MRAVSYRNNKHSGPDRETHPAESNRLQLCNYNKDNLFSNNFW
jgi:hypothetical protein